MRVHWGRKAEDQDAPDSREDGWELFGQHALSSLDGVGGVEGDGHDARVRTGVDYIDAVRRAKRGVAVVHQSMSRWRPYAQVETRASTTPGGEPMFEVTVIEQSETEPVSGRMRLPVPPSGYEFRSRIVEDKSGHWREEVRLYRIGCWWRPRIRVRSWFPKSAGTEFLAWYERGK